MVQGSYSVTISVCGLLGNLYLACFLKIIHRLKIRHNYFILLGILFYTPTSMQSETLDVFLAKVNIFDKLN